MCFKNFVQSHFLRCKIRNNSWNNWISEYLIMIFFLFYLFNSFHSQIIYVPIFFANICAFFYHKELSTLMPHMTHMVVLICILGMLLFFSNIFVQILLICGGTSQVSKKKNNFNSLINLFFTFLENSFGTSTLAGH